MKSGKRASASGNAESKEETGDGEKVSMLKKKSKADRHVGRERVVSDKKTISSMNRYQLLY